jgi:hypothetical protein
MCAKNPKGKKKEILTGTQCLAAPRIRDAFLYCHMDASLFFSIKSFLFHIYGSQV